MQQRSGPVDGTPTGDGVAVSDPGDRFEREAEATATALSTANQAGPANAPTAQRHADEEAASVQEMALQRQDEMEEEEPVQAMALQREGEMEEEEAAL